jgi:2-polyprenyl-3-methyl-5-hydroxy-6-metoxy-1,4-benzoquinol methylase
LEVAKRKGWEVYGTEYTDEAVAICAAKGINMIKGKLNPAHYAAESFDIITSFEVIEHINNPNEELSNF